MTSLASGQPGQHPSIGPTPRGAVFPWSSWCSLQTRWEQMHGAMLLSKMQGTEAVGPPG